MRYLIDRDNWMWYDILIRGNRKMNEPAKIYMIETIDEYGMIDMN